MSLIANWINLSSETFIGCESSITCGLRQSTLYWMALTFPKKKKKKRASQDQYLSKMNTVDHITVTTSAQLIEVARHLPSRAWPYQTSINGTPNCTLGQLPHFHKKKKIRWDQYLNKMNTMISFVSCRIKYISCDPFLHSAPAKHSSESPN